MSETVEKAAEAVEQVAESAAEKAEQKTLTMTQEQLDQFIGERLKRDREAREKQEAKAKQTVEEQFNERLREMEERAAKAERASLVSRVQAAHGLSDSDAQLFLTGDSEDVLKAQAERIAELAKPQKRGSSDGTNERSSADPNADWMRQLMTRAQ